MATINMIQLSVVVVLTVISSQVFAWQPNLLKMNPSKELQLTDVLRSRIVPDTMGGKGNSYKRLLPAQDTYRGLFQEIAVKLCNGSTCVSEIHQNMEINLMGTPSNATASDVEVSYACLNDTEQVIQDVAKNKTERYALKFIDAGAKVPYGILQGQVFWVGDYHECINIESKFNPFTEHSFTGRYYTVKVQIEQQNLYVGLCVPDSCDKNDVKALLSIISEELPVLNVYTSDGREMWAGDVVAICICTIILLVVIIGTSVDYIHSRFDASSGQDDIPVNGYKRIETTEATEKSGLLSNSMNEVVTSGLSTFTRAIKTFSIFTNTRKLMSTKTATGPLACLNGLRVISMFWVIQGHTYAFSELALKDITYASALLSQRFTFQAILNGTYSVDTFFFLSGLLVAYLALRELADKGRINWIYYFAHRYWRLTPIYAITLMFFSTIFTLMVTGPFAWLALDPEAPLYPSTTECHTYWWSNLLYINNLYPHYGAETNCMGWAWYLANDMQFYVFISPFVILLLHKKRLLGFIFSGFLIVSCIASRAITANYYGMNQSAQITEHKEEEWAISGPLYGKPYARWSVYVIGMLTGYFLQRTNCHFRIPRVVVVIGWAVSVAMGISVIYGLYYYNSHPGSVMNKTGTIFYLSCARTAWSVALAWLVIACATGNGGWVNEILSWKPWAPLGRLTYAAYLVHPMVLFGFFLNNVAPIQFTDLIFVYVFISNLVLSYAIAYIVSMAVEAPMMQLEKLILNRS